MVKDYDWQHDRETYKVILIINLILITSIIITILIELYFKNMVEKLIEYVLFFMLMGIIVSIIISSFFKIKGIFVTVFVLSMFILMAIISVFSELFWFIIIFYGLLLIIFGLEERVCRKSLKLLIEVKNDTSLFFYKPLHDELKKELDKMYYKYTNDWYNTFIITFSDNKKGELRFFSYDRFNMNNFYKITLYTRSKDNNVESLKQNIKKLVERMDKEFSIDEYSNYKLICNECKKRVLYTIDTDEYYCNKCSKYYKENEVEKIFIGLYE